MTCHFTEKEPRSTSQDSLFHGLDRTRVTFSLTLVSTTTFYSLHIHVTTYMYTYVGVQNS